MRRIQVSLLLSVLLVACNNHRMSFDFEPDSESFNQVGTPMDRKIDILWVIDNSHTMASSQDSIAINIDYFIDSFLSRDYDFQIGVTTTEAWLEILSPMQSHFRGYSDLLDLSGHGIIRPDTPNVKEAIISNIRAGNEGAGDERAFLSIMETLRNPNNRGLIRSDAFLAVIIISDEDDFSHDTLGNLNWNYDDPRLHTVERYVDELAEIKGSIDRFAVSAISVLPGDKQCLDALKASDYDRTYGVRYSQVVRATGGVEGSLCGNFAETLEAISDHIIELITRFELRRLPDTSTIRVYVDNRRVPENPNNGWQYDATTNSILFRGSAVPSRGAPVRVDFKPISFKTDPVRSNR